MCAPADAVTRANKDQGGMQFFSEVCCLCALHLAGKHADNKVFVCLQIALVLIDEVSISKLHFLALSRLTILGVQTALLLCEITMLALTGSPPE